MPKKRDDLCSNAGLYKPHPSSLTSKNYVDQTKDLRLARHAAFKKYFDLLHAQVVRKKSLTPEIIAEHPLFGTVHYYTQEYEVTNKGSVEPYSASSAQITGLNNYFVGQDAFSKGDDYTIANKDHLAIIYEGAKASVGEIYKTRETKVALETVQGGDSSENYTKYTPELTWAYPLVTINGTEGVLNAFNHPSTRYYAKYAIPYEYCIQYELVYYSNDGERDTTYTVIEPSECYYKAKIYEQIEQKDGKFSHKEIGELKIPLEFRYSYYAGSAENDKGSDIYKSAETFAMIDELNNEVFGASGMKKIKENYIITHSGRKTRYEGDGLEIYTLTPKSTAKFPKVKRTFDGKETAIVSLTPHKYSYRVVNKIITAYTSFALCDDGDMLSTQDVEHKPKFKKYTLFRGYSAENGFAIVRLCEWLGTWDKYHNVRAWDNPPKEKWYQKGLFAVIYVVVAVVVTVVVAINAPYLTGVAPGSLAGIGLSLGSAALSLTAFSAIAAELGIYGVAKLLSQVAKVVGLAATVVSIGAGIQNLAQATAQKALTTSALSGQCVANASSMPMSSALYANGLNSVGGVSTLSTAQLSSMGLNGGISSLSTAQLSTALSTYASNAGSMMTMLKEGFGLAKNIYSAYSQGKELFSKPSYMANDPDMKANEEEQDAGRINWGMMNAGQISLHRFFNSKEEYDIGDVEGTLIYQPSVREKLSQFWVDERMLEMANFFEFDFKKDKNNGKF